MPALNKEDPSQGIQYNIQFDAGYVTSTTMCCPPYSRRVDFYSWNFF